MSHLPAAVLGLVVCDALILYVIRRMRQGHRLVGLQSLREQAKMLGGSLLIASRAGTRVALRVPFDGRS